MFCLPLVTAWLVSSELRPTQPAPTEPWSAPQTVSRRSLAEEIVAVCCRLYDRGLIAGQGLVNLGSLSGDLAARNDSLNTLVEDFSDVQLIVDCWWFIVACFASHVHRVQQVLDAAARLDRKVALVGRSMIRNMRVAGDLGYLRVPPGLLVPVEDLNRLDPARTVVVSTGSQGEPYSALTLMAARDHKWVRIEPADTVVLSSSLIPGNEAAVYRTINDLARLGADVYHKGNARVHVSGHAAQGELTLLLTTLRPRNFLPVHGEYRHLAQHARLADAAGVPRERILVCEDGDVVELAGGVASIVGQVRAGMVFVDGLGVGDVGDAVLRDRRKLGGEGFVHVLVTIESQTGKVLAGPDIVTRGFVYEPESGDLIEEAKARVLDALERSAADGVVDPMIIKQHMRSAASALFKERTQRRPVIIPTVMEV